MSDILPSSDPTDTPEESNIVSGSQDVFHSSVNQQFSSVTDSTSSYPVGTFNCTYMYLFKLDLIQVWNIQNNFIIN